MQSREGKPDGRKPTFSGNRKWQYFLEGLTKPSPTRGKKKNVVLYYFQDISSLPLDTRYPDLYGMHYVTDARLSTCTQWRRMWWMEEHLQALTSASRPSRFDLGKGPWYQLNRTLGGSLSRCVRFGKKKNPHWLGIGTQWLRYRVRISTVLTCMQKEQRSRDSD